MKRYLLTISIITTLTLCYPILPENNSNLNYTHVLFEWTQVEDAQSYQLQISEDDTFLSILKDVMSESLIHVEKDSIDWNGQYFWRIRGLDSNQISGPWSNIFTFTTSEKRSEASSILYSDDDYSEGLTIFSSFFDFPEM